MNKVILIGRVTKAIELKTTKSNKSVATFTLAVNRDFKNADGNYDADFINCVAYEQRAETISKYVRKGDRFGVVGKINTRTFDRKDGGKGYATEVIVESFEFLESKKDKSVDVDVDEPPYNGSADDFAELGNVDDDDLPF
jgi:single-strand DNA-binding protein